MKPVYRLISCLWILGVYITMLTGCAVKRPVVFGFAGEITGTGSDLGISARNGVMLAVEKVNQDGGIDGRRLDVVVKDDQGNPEVAQAIDREFIDEEVVAIVGHITSSQSVAGLAVTQPAGMVMLSPISSSLALTGVDDLFFRVCADNMREIRVLSRHMVDEGQTRIVVIYDSDNQAFSLSYAQAVNAQMNLLGGTVLELIPYSASGQVDVTELVTRVKDMQPEAVLVVSSAVNTAILVQHIRLVDLQVPLYASDWAFSDAFILTGGRAVEDVLLMASFDVNSQAPEMLAFRETYREHYGYDPNYAAMQSYEAVLVLAAALRQTNGKADGLPDALRNIRDLQGLTSTISIDEFGDVIRPVYLFQVQDGKMVTVGTFTGN